MDEPTELEKEVLAELGLTIEADRDPYSFSNIVDIRDEEGKKVLPSKDFASNVIGRAIGSRRGERVQNVGSVSFPESNGKEEKGIVLQVNGETGAQILDKNKKLTDEPKPISSTPAPKTFAPARGLEPPLP